jgi:hypothetical protein
MRKTTEGTLSMPCLTGNEINRQKHHGVILFPGKEMKMDLPKTGYMGIPGIECLGGKNWQSSFMAAGMAKSREISSPGVRARMAG